MTSRAWAIPFVAALVAPMVTWLPLGYLATMNAVTGLEEWFWKMWFLMAFALIAALVGRSDLWLGAAVFLVSAPIPFQGFFFNATSAVYFALGALALVAVRQTPLRHHVTIARCLAALGLFQAVYMLQQEWFTYDFFWGPVFGGVPNAKMQPLGTLGTVDSASAYVAMTAPLMPLWALPVAIAAVLSGRSYGAIVALVVGLVVRFVVVAPRPGASSTAAGRGVRWLIPAGVLAALPVVVYYKELGGVWIRVAIWNFGLTDWLTNPVLGFGLGAWAQRIPELQKLARFNFTDTLLVFGRAVEPTRELFREAHNEYLQWVYETGAVGGAIALAWAKAHWRMLLHPGFGASVASLAVTAIGFFPFHVAPVAMLGLVLVGLASANPSHDFLEAA